MARKLGLGTRKGKGPPEEQELVESHDPLFVKSEGFCV